LPPPQVNRWGRKQGKPPCLHSRQIPNHPTPYVSSGHPSNLVGQEPPICRRSYEQSNDKVSERHQKSAQEPNIQRRKSSPSTGSISSGVVFSERQRSAERRRRLLPEALSRISCLHRFRKQSSEEAPISLLKLHTGGVASSRVILYNTKYIVMRSMSIGIARCI